MKKFKTKKKIKILKLLLYLLIVFFSYYLTRSYLMNGQIIDAKGYIESLLNEGLNNQLKEKKNKNVKIISNKVSLIEHNLSFTSKRVDNKSNKEEVEKYVKEVNESLNEPLIYIYNTHDGEEYKIEYKYEYSIIPNVKIASYILQEKLENLGINSYVETTPIKSILNQNNWIYRDSYRASKILLEQTIDKPSIKYYIDIHRDSAKQEKTYLEYDNKAYARIMFVVGLEHDNYEPNLEMAYKLSEMVNERVPNLCRGVLKKEGPGVNGIYNQDFSPNSMLIEIGGVDNNIIQVSNTIHILGEVLYSYIKGE